MQDSDIIMRIKTLCDARSWTFYRLAKESGITYSTLCTMLHKANVPSIPTLTKICNGFGITLAEFFDEGNDSVLLSCKEKEHLSQWNLLSAENQIIADNYIRFLIANQEKTDKKV